MSSLKNILGAGLTLFIYHLSFASGEIEKLRLASEFLNYSAKTSPARAEVINATENFLSTVERLSRCITYNNDPQYGNPPYISPDTGSCNPQRQAVFNQWKVVLKESQSDTAFMKSHQKLYQEIESSLKDFSDVVAPMNLSLEVSS